MKTTYTIFILACVLSASACAAGYGDDSYKTLRFGISVDYTRTAMEQVNGQLENGTGITPAGNAFTAMADVDLVVTPFLMVGARMGYLYCMPGIASYNFVIPVLYSQTSTINASLIPLEAGVIANIEAPRIPISLMLGVYAGYGIAFASYKNDISVAGTASSAMQPFNGGGIMGEVIAAINVKVTTALSFNVNGGYRLAKIAQMTQTEDASYSGFPMISAGAKGDILKDSNGNTLAFDFSGFIAGMGFSYGY